MIETRERLHATHIVIIDRIEIHQEAPQSYFHIALETSIDHTVAAAPTMNP